MAGAKYIGLAEWRSLLESLWDVDPGKRAALAIVVLLNDLAGKAIKLRDELVVADPDLLDDDEFEQASQALQSLLARVDVYADYVSSTDVEKLRAWIVAPVIDGVWPKGFPLVKQIGGVGFYYETLSGRESASGSWVGDGQLAAYAYNKMLAKVEGELEAMSADARSAFEELTGVGATFTEDTLRGALEDAKEKVGGPVRDFLNDAADKASELAKGAVEAAKDAASTIAWGFGLVLGGYVVLRLIESRRG